MTVMLSPLFAQIKGLCDERLYYRINAMIEVAAEDLANPTFNPMEVYYTRERLVPDGVEEIQTKSKGKSVDALTKKERTDERTGTAFITKHRVVVEEFYKTPQLHLQEFVTKIANFVVGQRGVAGLDGVRIERVTPLGEPWPLNLTKLRTDKAIARIRDRQLYRPPPVLTPPVPPPPPSESDSVPVPTAKGGKGMRRSST